MPRQRRAHTLAPKPATRTVESAPLTEPLTKLERQVYDYLVRYLAEHTYQPTVRDIAARFNIKSTRTAAQLLQALEAKGHISRKSGRSRGLRLIQLAGAKPTRQIPIVQAAPESGADLLAATEFVSVDSSFPVRDDGYAIRHDGDDIPSSGILRGDLLLINPAGHAEDNSLVLARVQGKRIIAHLARRGGTTALLPAGAEDRPMELRTDSDVAVLGIVAGVLRQLA